MSTAEKPAVSCICVTQNRRFFLRRAIAYFWRAEQYFEHITGQKAELVIVDGSAQDNSDLLDTAISFSGERMGKWLRSIASYHHAPSPSHSRTGWFHNEAVRLSKGDIIVQWDDDDWHDGLRIFKQWETLLNQHEPSLTFTSRFFWYHLLEARGCLSRTWHQGGGSVGAMFAYHRATWELAPFRDVPQGEDNYFWDDHIARKTPLVDSRDPSFCVYVRHNRNGSPLIDSETNKGATSEVRGVLRATDDLDFYDELTELMPLDPWNRLSPSRGVSPYGNTHAVVNLMNLRGKR